jgi:glutathionylspermidine synthase
MTAPLATALAPRPPPDVRLTPIPPDRYPAYRREVVFAAHKWDPQVGDVNTVADHVAILRRDAARGLAEAAEGLAAETLALEDALRRRPDLHAELGLPAPVRRALSRAATAGDPRRHARVMRFDFHPTADGWAVSEVNSDVPGGFAEASALPRLAARYAPDAEPYPADVGAALAEAVARAAGRVGRVGLVHATSYADDRQVMECLAGRLTEAGFRCAFLAPDHVRWNGGARSVALGQEGELAALVRFFPVEWLPSLPRAAGWAGYFSDAVAACNHASAILTQSKRLPLVWDRLGVPLAWWPRLLPPTAEPPRLPWRLPSDWVLKPALGRVGEGITLPEAMPAKARRRAAWDAARYRRQWVAQRRFASRPAPTANGERHVCVGVFTVNGRAAGFYGRMSARPRIDEQAQDVAVLVERGAPGAGGTRP